MQLSRYHFMLSKQFKIMYISCICALWVLLQLLGRLICNYCIFFLPQHKKIDISIIIMNAQTDINSFFCIVQRVFSFNWWRCLSCYRTDFHEIEVYREYNYMYVHVQAALIHFDGCFLFTDVVTCLIPKKLVMGTSVLCSKFWSGKMGACMQWSGASNNCIMIWKGSKQGRKSELWQPKVLMRT